MEDYSIVERNAFARGEKSGVRWGAGLALFFGFLVVCITGAFAYDLGRRTVQSEAIKSGKAHYVPSECPDNFRWNE